MSASFDPKVCVNCSSRDSPNANLICSKCQKSCCSQCAQEPAESISLFNVPIIFCTDCSVQGQQENEVLACKEHPDQNLDLYCLTCEEQICCDCFLLLGEHKRHTIDSVEVVYAQKRLETLEMFGQISKNFKLIDWEAVREVGNSLALVEAAENQILTEVQQMVQEKTTMTMNMVQEKKEALTRTKELGSRAHTQFYQVMKTFNEERSGDFILQQRILQEQCQKILDELNQLQMNPVRLDDIRCDILTSCKPFAIIVHVPNEASLEEQMSFHFTSEYIQCFIDFQIGPDSLVFDICPHKQLGTHRFKATAEILRLDQEKTFCKSFIFVGKLERADLISIDELRRDGYLDNVCDLRIQIAIRPENIVEEKNLLKSLLKEQMESNTALNVELGKCKDKVFLYRGDNLRLNSEVEQMREAYKKQIIELNEKIRELRQCPEERAYASSNSIGGRTSPYDVAKEKLSLDMKRLQAKLETMKITMKSMNPFAIGYFEICCWSNDSKFYSPEITSYNGTSIYIIVQPNFSNENNSAVNAYICWAKGPKKSCEVFVEIVSEFEEECVREDRVFDFSKSASFTWKSIITHFMLFRKTGFLRDDNMKVKFGVRPSLDNMN